MVRENKLSEAIEINYQALNINMSEYVKKNYFDLDDNVENSSNHVFVEDLKENSDEAIRKFREPAIVFRNIQPKYELEELVKLLDGKISKDDECAVEELHQYIIEDEGCWTLGEHFLEFVKQVLVDPSFLMSTRVHLIRVLAYAALKDDIVLLLHQDRKDHILMNYSQDIDKHPLQEQQAFALFICNLFENANSSEWLLYISEWQHESQLISNIRCTTKVAVHGLLATDAILQEIGSCIMFNLAKMEIKTVIFDDIVVELTMAILQFFKVKPSEEHLFRTLTSLLRFLSISSDIGQFILMIGPHPIVFQGQSERNDLIIADILKKVPAP